MGDSASRVSPLEHIGSPRAFLAISCQVLPIVTDDGTALSKARVELFPVTEDGRVTFSSTHIIITDEDGSFRFTGVGPKSESKLYLTVVSDAKGYVPELTQHNDGRNPIYRFGGDDMTIPMIKGGAITGKISNAKGEPVVGAYISVEWARDAQGKPIHGESAGLPVSTDDRGVYRFYGLRPGTYVVFTHSKIAGPISCSDAEFPTYHPSSTRDTAVEVAVTSGGEASGIDIRHRGDRGRTLSGVVSGGKEASSQPAASVSLFDTSAAMSAGSSYVQQGGARGFAFSGLPDGEYSVIARSVGDDVGLASAPRHVSLRGADVTGIELKLAPLASISGRIVVENPPDVCGGKGKVSLGEFTVVAIRDDLSKDDLALQQWRISASPRANEKGEFTINDVSPGHSRIEARLPGENLYVKTITTPANIPARRGAPAAANDVSRNGVALKQGDKLAGVTVTVAEGAASLRGKVVAEKTSARLPERLRLHLIPAEQKAAGDVLRYAETLVRSDSAFVLNNIAPGKYWLIARAAPDDEPGDLPVAPIAWDANERAKLRREAEALKIEVELKPCQRETDQTVRYSAK